MSLWRWHSYSDLLVIETVARFVARHYARTAFWFLNTKRVQICACAGGVVPIAIEKLDHQTSRWDDKESYGSLRFPDLCAAF